ncbi:SusC/RagA family TonB-linked outer membrane protein [Adhaeribacter aerolatus]|uniref:SusC/RagA family TonB-linked outer membrane protein n=1 Tax=Adhaeribacter aerolatus TaxID=670289 RepID=A0A512B2D2_9BACT|nr:TonB-dependent receptor [Adhaeribacter aerolatus]GEO06124.1 SusC/RagA family TonB-linked outer membrane protein [Adhaeribacter aerolatus]
MPNFLHQFKWLLSAILLTSSLSGVHGQQMTAFHRNQKQNKTAGKKEQVKSLVSILSQIKEQYQVNFHYDSDLLNPKEAEAFVLESDKQNLDLALEQLLKPLKLTFIKADVNSYIIVPMPTSVAQEKPVNINNAVELVVSGKVTDKKGEALPGVTVLLKGTTVGTATGTDGTFSLKLPDATGTLVISFIGYTTQEVAVPKSGSLNITLEDDAKALQEVVVVGYGTQSKRNVTGAVTKVDLQQTESFTNTNVAQAMRGRVAGVQFVDNGRPGQGGNIVVRGSRSLTAGNNPLVVLDGIIFGGNLSDINPNDIESMEVLKDASAAAIYGSRAANGVILITSKKGKTEKPNIRANTFYGVSDWSYKVKLLSPERYNQLLLDWRQQSGQTADPAKIEEYLQVSEVENYRNNRTVDPWDAISQKAHIASYDLSISGRTEKTNYFLSGAFADEKGLVLNDNFQRLTLRSNIENTITNWLTIGTHANYIRRDLSGTEANISQAYKTSPYGTLYYPDGTPTRYMVPEETLSENPVRRAFLNQNEEIYNNLFANFYAILNAPFLEGLSYRVNFSPNYRWNNAYDFIKQDINLDFNNTQASKLNRQDYSWVWENIVTYNKQINSNHAFDVTLLYGQNHSEYESTTANASQLANATNGWNDLGLGLLQTVTSTGQAVDGLSSMFRLNYRLKDKYLATFTVRRDGSSVFAKNNKYATFPSAALAWIASEEPFLQNINFIDNLKVRLSYGAVGNQAISPYQSLSLANTTQYVFGDGGSTSTGVFPASMANPDLKWETTKTANAAIDFDLFKNRLGGTIEVYNMDTEDLIVNRLIPVMTGFSRVYSNLGATNNKGVELSLNTLNLSAGKFEWSSNLAFSSNKSKIVHLYNSDTNGDGREDDDLGNKWIIGRPVSVAYDFVFDGIYQEGEDLPAGYKPGFVKLKDLNNDGKIDAANDRAVIGQLDPKYRWGLTNTFKYGNFTLTAFVNAMTGWVSSINNLDFTGSSLGQNYPGRPVNMLDAGWWTPDNKSNTRPSLVYTNPFLHNYYVSRDFVRLQDVSVAYAFPESVLNTLRVNNLRLYLSGKNLYTITNWIGPDPESGYNNQNNYYPTAKTFTVGLNIGF